MSFSAAMQRISSTETELVKRSGDFSILHSKCGCGSAKSKSEETCEHCKKNKLATRSIIGDNNDPLEYEADRIANQVMAMDAPALQRSSDGDSPGPPGFPWKQPLTHSNVSVANSCDKVPPQVLDVLRAPGQALDRETRAFMEARFGYDFSQIKVHTGAAAALSARVIGANAYALGSNLVFGDGRYSSGTQEGKSLIAHELVHTIQQGSSGSRMKNRASLQQSSPVTRTFSIGSGISRTAPLIQRQPTATSRSEVPLTDTAESQGSVAGGAQPNSIFHCGSKWAECRLSCFKPKARKDCADCCSKAFDTCLEKGSWITRVRGCNGLGAP